MNQWTVKTTRYLLLPMVSSRRMLFMFIGTVNYEAFVIEIYHCHDRLSPIIRVVFSRSPRKTHSCEMNERALRPSCLWTDRSSVATAPPLCPLMWMFRTVIYLKNTTFSRVISTAHYIYNPHMTSIHVMWARRTIIFISKKKISRVISSAHYTESKHNFSMRVTCFASHIGGVFTYECTPST